MTPLTEHFFLEDLIRSEVAARRGISNAPSPEIFRNLIRLCEEILEPLRNAVSRPIFVTSGYRCPQLNQAVGGAPNSRHMTGLAADITAPGTSVEALMEVVHTLSPFVPLDRAIIEFGQWLHVSCLPVSESNNKPEPEFLAAKRVDDQVVYVKWVSAMSA